MLSVGQVPRSEELDLLFGALADPTRRAIVEQLAVSEATVSELAAPFTISLPAISRHLRVLERASIITRSQEGRWRRVRLTPSSLASTAAWLSQCERLWSDRLSRLEELLHREQLEPSASDTNVKTSSAKGSS